MPGAENVAEGQRCSMTQEARGFSKGLGLCEVVRAAVRRRFVGSHEVRPNLRAV